MVVATPVESVEQMDLNPFIDPAAAIASAPVGQTPKAMPTETLAAFLAVLGLPDQPLVKRVDMVDVAISNTIAPVLLPGVQNSTQDLDREGQSSGPVEPEQIEADTNPPPITIPVQQPASLPTVELRPTEPERDHGAPIRGQSASLAEQAGEGVLVERSNGSAQEQGRSSNHRSEQTEPRQSVAPVPSVDVTKPSHALALSTPDTGVIQGGRPEQVHGTPAVRSGLEMPAGMDANEPLQRTQTDGYSVSKVQQSVPTTLPSPNGLPVYTVSSNNAAEPHRPPAKPERPSLPSERLVENAVRPTGIDATRLAPPLAAGQVDAPVPDRNANSAPVSAVASPAATSAGKSGGPDGAIAAPLFALATPTADTNDATEWRAAGTRTDTGTAPEPEPAAPTAPIQALRPSAALPAPADPVQLGAVDLDPTKSGDLFGAFAVATDHVTESRTAVPAVLPTLPHGQGARMAEAISRSPDRPVEITLAPEELGRVRMSITTQDGALTMLLQADRPETLDLLRRHIDTLAQDFKDIGFENLSFSFGQNSNPQHAVELDDTAEQRGTGDVLPASKTNEIEANLQPNNQHRDGGLDLRL
ncbi:MAG: flagellar hook-length control protein FliK [Albidovulum sp.]